MKKTKYPIFIPSKGRANNCYTAKNLSKYDIEYFLVVEKQDKEDYLRLTDNILVLDETNKGLTYARTWIKEYAKKQGFDFHWQIDDDVMYFLTQVNGKNTSVDPFNMFLQVEETTDQYENIAYSSFRDSTFAFSIKEDISFNKMKSTVVLFNSFIDIKWTPDLLEDYDYSLSCLFAGYCSILFNRLMYTKKPNNSEIGGIKASGRKYDQLNENLALKYKEFIKTYFNEKGNLKVNARSVWKIFSQRPILKGQKINRITNFFESDQL